MRKTNDWLSYQEAKKIIHKVNLSGKSAYEDWSKTDNRPQNIPAAPRGVYQKQGTWISWPDYLGNGQRFTQNIQYRSFENAREYAHSLKLKSRNEWYDFKKTEFFPKDIPHYPDAVYKNSRHGNYWEGWNDWLGTDKTRKEWLSFTEARKFVHGLKLQTFDEYLKFCRTNKKLKNIPNDPFTVYKKEWNGTSNWLGTQKFSKRKGLRNFEEARKFVHGLNLKSMKEYTKYCQSGNKPIDIPNKPEYSYKKEWNGNGDWLGTGTIAAMKKQEYYLPWPEAKKEYQRLAREHGIKNTIQWRQFKKDHKGLLEKLKLPAEPQRVYTKERVWKKEYEKLKNKN